MSEPFTSERLAKMSRAERLHHRSRLMMEYLTENQDAGNYFLQQDQAQKEELKRAFYDHLEKLDPNFGRIQVGTRTKRVPKTYRMNERFGERIPETYENREVPIYAPLLDDTTEYQYESLEKGLVTAEELYNEVPEMFVRLGAVANQRKSPTAAAIQKQAQKYSEEMGIGEGLATFGGFTSGIVKPLADISVAAAEAVGTDTTARDKHRSLLALAYPKRVQYEDWGKMLGVLGGSVAVYQKLGQKGLSTVVRKEAGKRKIAYGALAATGAAEFGLGYGYNSPTMFGGENRVMSGVEAMLLGSALNLAVDAALPLRGMSKKEVTEYLNEDQLRQIGEGVGPTNRAEYDELSPAGQAGVDQASRDIEYMGDDIPAPQNVELAEQVRDAPAPQFDELDELNKDLARQEKRSDEFLANQEAMARQLEEQQAAQAAREAAEKEALNAQQAEDLQRQMQANQMGEVTSTPVTEGTNPLGVTEEGQRILDIDRQIREIQAQERIIRKRPGKSSKELNRLKSQRKALNKEKTLLENNHLLNDAERAAEERNPGAILGIHPYAADAMNFLSRDEVKVRIAQELMLRTHVGALAASSPLGTDMDEEYFKGSSFLLGFALGSPRQFASIKKLLPQSVRERVGRHVKDVGKGGEYILDPLDYRIGKISPMVANALNRMEMTGLISNKYYMDKAIPFFNRLQELQRRKLMHSVDREDLSLAIFNSDTTKRDILFDQIDPTGALKETYAPVGEMLTEILDEGLKVGVLKSQLTNYYPRSMLDHQGFLESRGLEMKPEFDKQVALFKQESGRNPTTHEQSNILNILLRGKSGEAGSSHAKKRVIDQLERGDLKFYSSLEDSLTSYIFDISRRIHKRKFLGHGYQLGKLKTYTTPDGDKRVIRDEAPEVNDRGVNQGSIIRESVGEDIRPWIEGLKDQGHIDKGKVEELIRLLDVRINHGEKGFGPKLAAWRNVHYMTTIGNPFSTMTQLSDIALAAVKNPKATGNVLGQAIRKFARGKGGITEFHRKGFDFSPEDLGLISAAEDMMSISKSGKTLDTILKYSGFRWIDKVGKATHLSSSYQRLKKMASAPENSAAFKKFKEEQLPVFGQSDFDNLTQALRNGDKNNENVRLALWNDLSEIQPISLSNMPEAYVKAENGRIVYALKSFTVKQIGFMRKNMLDKMANAKTYAEFKEGMANYFKFITFFGGATMGANALKDFAAGREVTIEDRAVDAMMQVMGVSRYHVYKFRDIAQGGDVGRELSYAIGNTVFPFAFATDTLEDMISWAGGDLDLQSSKGLKHLPIFGKGLYWRIGKGAERERKKRIKKRNRKPNFGSNSPSLKPSL